MQVWREACHADVALLNAGTLRSGEHSSTPWRTSMGAACKHSGDPCVGNFPLATSSMPDFWRPTSSLASSPTDRIHPAGEVTHRDLVSVLPMLDETVVIEVTGEHCAVLAPCLH